MNKRFKILYYIVCWIFIFFVLGLLVGCTKQTPVESAFDDAHNAIIIAKDSLPKECQTADVLQKIELAETKYEKAQVTCESQIKDVEAKYEHVLWVLFAVIFVFLAKFFIKR